MSRLPPALQPLWPQVKRAHRAGARAMGALGRRTGSAWVPRTASAASARTSALEPQTVRRHPVPLAPQHREVRRTMPVGDPAGHPYFAAQLAVDSPEPFVLELSRGRLLGPHAAVVTAGGVLDAETSHYFDIAGWREHPVFLNPRPRAPEHVEGTVAVLASRGTSHNYYHFVIDALPRIGMLRAALGDDLAPDAWVVNRATRYERELLDLVGVPGDARLIEPGRGFSLSADRLLVPSLPNASTLVTPATTTWLRETFAARRTAAGGGLPELLYVTRGTTPHTRRMVREAEVRARLEARGFVTIDPGTLSVREQIDHFGAARVVVAPHGAALTNLVFAAPGVRVLELFVPGYVNGGYWSITATIPDARYRYLVADGAAGRRNNKVMQDIDLDPDAVELALEALLAD